MTGYDELYRCEQLSLCGHNSTVACPFLRHGRRTTEPRCAGRTALLDRMGGRLRRLPVRLTTAWVQALRARASLWHRTRPCCAQAATLQPSPAALHLLIPRGPPDPSNIHFRTTNCNNPSTTAAATTTTATPPAYPPLLPPSPPPLSPPLPPSGRRQCTRKDGAVRSPAPTSAAPAVCAHRTASQVAASPDTGKGQGVCEQRSRRHPPVPGLPYPTTSCAT